MLQFLILMPLLIFQGRINSSDSVIIMKSEFVFENASFPSCHASTIAETPAGLVVAFFGGTAEKNPDVGIWLCRYTGQNWTVPLEVATGIQGDGKRFPCWNPVLYKYKDGLMMLFYKVGPSPSEWWGMLIKSYDNGKTWSRPIKLPDGFLGPVKNKPLLLKSGILLCPSSTEPGKWKVHMEMTSDTGRTWTKANVAAGEKNFSSIQPSILVHEGGKFQILCRSREGCITQSWSNDNGETWSSLSASSLPNPNSGIDAVTLKNRTHLLVYNPTTTSGDGRGGPRTPLCAAISSDGKNWKDVITLEKEPGEYSYPAVIQTSDGFVHITYTWNRKLIKHVVIELGSI
jgi:predicted neuraminidase